MSDAPQNDSVKSVVGGDSHTCALMASGKVKCWGGGGRLGTGDLDNRGDDTGEMGAALPYVDLGTDVRAASLDAGYRHTCALLADGRIKCWGINFFGQLGLGDTQHRGDGSGAMGDELPYVDLGVGARAVALVAGQEHTCALLEGGAVKCWGMNAHGELGLGDTEARGDQPGEMGDALPAVNLGAQVIQIDAGDFHTCARLSSGKLVCWGSNVGGQLGLGDTEDRGDQPGEMGDALPEIDLGQGTAIVSLFAGGFTCVLLEGGSLKCWGPSTKAGFEGHEAILGDEPGEMGDALPALDLGSSAAVATMAFGQFHSCAWLTSGALKCWGTNAYGQLGLGDKERRGDQPGEMGDALLAIDLGSEAKVSAIGLGGFHSCAVLEQGRLKCWGGNFHGQLGLGDKLPRGTQPFDMGDSLPSFIP